MNFETLLTNITNDLFRTSDSFEHFIMFSPARKMKFSIKDFFSKCDNPQVTHTKRSLKAISLFYSLSLQILEYHSPSFIAIFETKYQRADQLKFIEICL